MVLDKIHSVIRWLGQPWGNLAFQSVGVSPIRHMKGKGDITRIGCSTKRQLSKKKWACSYSLCSLQSQNSRVMEEWQHDVYPKISIQMLLLQFIACLSDYAQRMKNTKQTKQDQKNSHTIILCFVLKVLCASLSFCPTSIGLQTWFIHLICKCAKHYHRCWNKWEASAQNSFININRYCWKMFIVEHRL